MQAQTYKMFTIGAKLFSWEQQCKNNQDLALWTAVTRSNHPAFLPGNKALTMALLSFCFMWQQGFEHATKMLPVYQHLSPGRVLSLSRGGTGSSSNSISEASVVCWGKQACLHADTFPSVHSLFWVAAKKKEHQTGGSFLSGMGEQSHFYSSSPPLVPILPLWWQNECWAPKVPSHSSSGTCLHLGLSFPSKASRRRTSPPTSQCRSSRRRWQMWICGRQSLQGLSIEWGSSLPKWKRNGEKPQKTDCRGGQRTREKSRNSSSQSTKGCYFLSGKRHRILK